MRKTAIAIAVPLLALTMGIGERQAAAQQSVTIRAEHDEPPGSITDRLLKEMAGDIEKKTEGRLRMDVHPGASLSGGKIPTMIQNVQAGSVDLSFISSGVYASIEPRLAVVSLPFLCAGIDDLERITRKSDVLDKINADQEKRNLEIVDTWTRALRQIANNKREIASPKDIEGLRFRVPEFKLWIEAFKAMGATPVPMPFSEIPTALQLGTIDGAERPSEFLETEKWWELAKYVTMTNYSGDVLLVAFNKPFWDKLDKPSQQLLRTSLEAYGDKKFQEEKRVEAGVVETLKKNGVKVTILTPEQKAKFREAMTPVWKDNEKRIGKDLIAAVEKVAGEK